MAKENKFPFSIALIVRNETKTIERLISSCQKFLDEGGDIVVTDTGSTDDTVAKCKKLGLKVIEVGDKFATKLTAKQAKEINREFVVGNEGPLAYTGERVVNLGAARTAAGQFTLNDMILQVDASDVFRAFDFHALRDILNGPHKYKRLGYRLKVGNCSLLIERFYNRKTTYWNGRVHEVLQQDYKPTEKFNCPETILMVEHIRDQHKVRHYISGMALDVIENRKSPRWKHYFGREMFYKGMWRSAIALLSQHVDLCTAFLPERNESLCIMGKCYEKIEEPTKAIECYWKAFQLDPTRRNPLLCLAEFEMSRGNFLKAICMCQASLPIKEPGFGFAEDEENYTTRPHDIMAKAYTFLNRDIEAAKEAKISRILSKLKTQLVISNTNSSSSTTTTTSTTSSSSVPISSPFSNPLYEIIFQSVSSELSNLVEFDLFGARRTPRFLIDIGTTSLASDLFHNHQWSGITFDARSFDSSSTSTHTFVQACLSDTIGSKVKFWQIGAPLETSSGMCNSYDNDFWEELKLKISSTKASLDITQIGTTTLNHQLAELKFGHVIDVMIVNVNGAELTVLKGIDLNKWHVQVIFVAEKINQFNMKIYEYLSKQGFIFLLNYPFYSIYVHPEFQPLPLSHYSIKLLNKPAPPKHQSIYGLWKNIESWGNIVLHKMSDPKMIAESKNIDSSTSDSNSISTSSIIPSLTSNEVLAEYNEESKRFNLCDPLTQQWYRELEYDAFDKMLKSFIQNLTDTLFESLQVFVLLDDSRPDTSLFMNMQLTKSGIPSSAISFVSSPLPYVNTSKCAPLEAHLKALQTFLASGKTMALVFEAYAMMRLDFIIHIHSLLRAWDSRRFPLCLLSAFLCQRPSPQTAIPWVSPFSPNTHFFHTSNNVWSSLSYLITRPHAQALIERFTSHSPSETPELILSQDSNHTCFCDPPLVIRLPLQQDPHIDPNFFKNDKIYYSTFAKTTPFT